MRNFRNAPNVLSSVLSAKAKIPCQPLSEIVAVKDAAVISQAGQTHVAAIDDRRLSSRWRTSQPDHVRLLALLLSPDILSNRPRILATFNLFRGMSELEAIHTLFTKFSLFTAPTTKL